MPEQNGERSHDPTPHRRRKAREQGQVARSQDLTSAVILLAGAVAVLVAGERFVKLLTDFTRHQLGGPTMVAADFGTIVRFVHQIAWDTALAVAPIFIVVFLAGVVTNLLQMGFLFLPDRLVPDLNRVNPIKGLERLFSLSNVVRLGFGIFKLLVVASVAGVFLASQFESVLNVAALYPSEIASFIADLLVWTTIRVGIALFVLAILDFGFQYWKNEQDLKMTTEEVREELRNLEGDPQVAARRRVVQRQLALNRMSQAIPNSDVVVTNPTELAVALKYDPETMAAPVVTAKGAGLTAQRIRRLALEHGIPIVEKKPLAQALYKNVEINQPIPQDLYATVAEVLAYVYQLNGKKFPKRAA
ncbi:MAG: flagellar biosynthesis protein FlhB [Planctomycetota bacterium]|nr:MAG: flagellar biosynthesis protein FlhB [Planctomycetota bacterium]